MCAGETRGFFFFLNAPFSTLFFWGGGGGERICKFKDLTAALKSTYLALCLQLPAEEKSSDPFFSRLVHLYNWIFAFAL